MAKTQVKTHPKSKASGRRPATVLDVRVSASDGGKVDVLSIDANSESFAEDFLYVFAKNVRAARQENKKLLGSASGAQKAK